METEMESKIDKRTKEYRDMVRDAINHSEPPIGVVESDETQAPPDYSKIENNPGFKLCMECGKDKLALNEDGSLRVRRQPEACYDCVHENENKILCVDGIIRDRGDCKRVVTVIGEDEVITWVGK